MTNLFFLDIDGVLNNTESLKRKVICDFHSAIFENRPFEKDGFNFNEHSLQALRHVLANVSDLTVVISSNWRYHSNENNFKDLFDMLDLKVNKVELMDQEVEDPIYYKRSFIISKHLKNYWKVGKLGKWAAVDDRPDLYHSDFQNIVFTNPDDGFTMDDAAKVVAIFNKD